MSFEKDEVIYTTAIRHQTDDLQNWNSTIGMSDTCLAMSQQMF